MQFLEQMQIHTVCISMLVAGDFLVKSELTGSLLHAF